MNDIFAMYADGVCKKIIDSTEPRTPIHLTASVGEQSRNLDSDVRTVQDALNYVMPEVGGPFPKLPVNGNCGPLTIAAINKFQLKQFGRFDGRVYPDNETIKRLARFKGGLTSLSKQKAISALGEALKLVEGAQTNLLMALPLVGQNGNPGKYPTLGRDERMRLANKHFEIDKADDPADTLRRVVLVYTTMLEIFRHPGGLWGSAIFEPDPLASTGRAFTFGGGYFINGVRSPKDGNIRKDSIYLTEKLERDTTEKCAHTIVHELAHFVGSKATFEPISDNGTGYGWFDDPCIQRLAPDEKVSNAENYANFAFDLKYGRAPISTQR